MRCVAPNSENGNANPDGPDERCQRCERAGLECIYVDRKRRGPGAVFGVQVDGTPTGPGGATGSFDGFTGQAQTQITNPSQTQNPTPNGTAPTAPDQASPNTPSQRPPAKKLKREGSPRTSSPYSGNPRREDTLMQLVPGEDGRMQRVMGEDAARALEETFADEDDDRRSR
ncbi:hypothetical protein FS749_013283 [Ceratobasidium sp. UAMH 11750]|nr:hypothetical protein FS749_013283 [Ceratobasidium sp. UAMH 11750]